MYINEMEALYLEFYTRVNATCWRETQRFWEAWEYEMIARGIPAKYAKDFFAVMKAEL